MLAWKHPSDQLFVEIKTTPFVERLRNLYEKLAISSLEDPLFFHFNKKIKNTLKSPLRQFGSNR